eukprot:3639922-Amphidinium_carterae.1
MKICQLFTTYCDNTFKQPKPAVPQSTASVRSSAVGVISIALTTEVRSMSPCCLTQCLSTSQKWHKLPTQSSNFCPTHTNFVSCCSILTSTCRALGSMLESGAPHECSQ